MLVQLGQHGGDSDVVDLLYECHGRIRRFLDLASRLAAAPDVEATTVRDASAQVRRYFVEAFPLHLADEDELVVPALRGQAEVLDDALARMQAEHVDHVPFVAELVDICATIHADPRQLVASTTRLAGVTSALRAALEPHLALEEATIFPALRALPDDARTAIKHAMRKRRAV